MFGNTLVEAREGVLKLSDIGGKAFEKLMEHIYVGKLWESALAFEAEVMEELLNAAEKVRVNKKYNSTKRKSIVFLISV
jgi:hypothetical protein